MKPLAPTPSSIQQSQPIAPNKVSIDSHTIEQQKQQSSPSTMNQQLDSKPQSFFSPTIDQSDINAFDAEFDSLLQKKLSDIHYENKKIQQNQHEELLAREKLLQEQYDSEISKSRKWALHQLEMLLSHLSLCVSKIDSEFHSNWQSLNQELSERLIRHKKLLQESNVAAYSHPPPWYSGTVGEYWKKMCKEHNIPLNTDAAVILPVEATSFPLINEVPFENSSTSDQQQQQQDLQLQQEEALASNRKQPLRDTKQEEVNLPEPDYGLSAPEIEDKFREMQEKDNSFHERERLRRVDDALLRGYETVIDVYVDPVSKNLVYGTREFSEGARVYIIDQEHAWLGTVVHIDENAIQIKYQDGAKSRVILDKLRANKYSLEPATANIR